MQARVVHFEVPYDDQDRATTFYREVFGWEIQAIPEMDYHFALTGPTDDNGPTEPGFIDGGMMKREGAVSGPVLTLAVEDIDAALAQIEGAGGATVTGRQQVGEMGFAAYFTDPEGNLLGLWQTAR